MIDMTVLLDVLANFFENEFARISRIDDTRLLFLVFAVALVLLAFRLLRSRFWLFFYFTFLSTLMHELAHFVMALITNGKPRGLSLMPEQRLDGIVLGQVLAGNLKWYNGTLIALAPVVSWALGYYFFFAFVLSETALALLVVKVYFLASLIEGGLPSSSDFRTAIKFGAIPFGLAVMVGAGFYFGQARF